MGDMPALNVSPAASPARQPALPALTGIRTLLACNIVLFHFTPGRTGYAAPFIQNGFVFVGFFFLLSGYVLAYNYTGRALTLRPRDFWIARFARLYPVYALTLLLSFRMLRLEWHARPRAEFWQGVVLTPLLLQGWNPWLATFWNTVGWTLSCELVLYAAFPGILRLWARRATPLETPARLAGLFLVLWLAGMVPHLLYLRFNPDHLPQPITRYSYGFWLRALKYSPPSYLCMFMAGVVLGKLQLLLPAAPRRRLALAAVGVAGVGAFFYTGVDHVPYLFMHAGLLLPLFAVLTLGLSGANAIASVFAMRPLLVVGESTYCLYMLHFNGINLMREEKLWERLHLAPFDPWISYAAILGVALAAHYLVEKPARKALLKRMLPQSKSPAGAGPF